MTDKPTSSETDELLIPDGVKMRIPDFRLPEFQGLGLGIAFTAGAVIAGLALFAFLPSPILSRADRGLFPENFSVLTLAYLSYGLFALVIPQLAALVMLWIAFVRIDVRDRYLWSAIMIISSLNIAGVLDEMIKVPAHRFLSHAPVEFVNAPIVSGLITYGVLHFAFARGERKPVMAAVAAVALCLLVLVPLLINEVSWATTLCSLLLAMGLWAIGVWIAQRVGFNVYASDEAIQPEG